MGRDEMLHKLLLKKCLQKKKDGYEAQEDGSVGRIPGYISTNTRIQISSIQVRKPGVAASELQAQL